MQMFIGSDDGFDKDVVKIQEENPVGNRNRHGKRRNRRNNTNAEGTAGMSGQPTVETPGVEPMVDAPGTRETQGTKPCVHCGSDQHDLATGDLHPTAGWGF